MKLPNFFDFEPLNTLKAKMGIGREVYGSLTVHISAARLSEIELEKLSSAEGIDVSLDDITVLEDGTLAYKNSRVILYIRDVSQFGGREFMPRFHLSNCAKLQEMKTKKRFDRYVVSTRLDGHFVLNIMGKGKPQTGLHKLAVCQLCMDQLAIDGFALSLSSTKRIQMVQSFRLGRFFEIYPMSLHSANPRFNADNAPLNDYTPDFPVISRAIREAAGWVCDGCDLDLSHPDHRKYLHAHHIDSQKWDNSRGNIRPLCIECHASQPDHSHIKSDRNYRDFMMIKSAAGFPRGRRA